MEETPAESHGSNISARPLCAWASGGFGGEENHRKTMGKPWEHDDLTNEIPWFSWMADL